MPGARNNVTQYQNVSRNISTQEKCLAFQISTITLKRLWQEPSIKYVSDITLVRNWTQVPAGIKEKKFKAWYQKSVVSSKQ